MKEHVRSLASVIPTTNFDRQNTQHIQNHYIDEPKDLTSNIIVTSTMMLQGHFPTLPHVPGHNFPTLPLFETSKHRYNVIVLLQRLSLQNCKFHSPPRTKDFATPTARSRRDITLHLKHIFASTRTETQIPSFSVQFHVLLSEHYKSSI